MSAHCMRVRGRSYRSWPIGLDAEHAAGELQVRFHCGVQGLGGFVDRRGRVCPVAVAGRAFAGGGLLVGDLLEGWACRPSGAMRGVSPSP